MAIDSKVIQWRNLGLHLPKFLRDFHDQKDFVKAMHYYTTIEEVKDLKEINNINGHIYIIDIFLWFAARYGYTLQKTKKNLEFEDLQNAISSYSDQERKKIQELLMNSK